tara:strand:+ start:10340 stop:10783 length:444 start_codon:yes stop_codon:yes gene_type:complete
MFEVCMKSQWFLAHSKKDEPEEIELWCKEIGENLTGDGWEAFVISGRDDYANRSAAMGGWKAWCRDVPSGTDYAGHPMYHGVIVPADSLIEEPTVGKATAQIIEGFLREGKHAYTWCPDSKKFKQIYSVETLPNDDWVAWAKLVFES